MNRFALFAVMMTMVLLAAVPVGAEITANVSVDDILFVTYEFADVDQTVYDQARIEFTAERIPEAIVDNLEATNQTAQWGLGPLPLDFDDANRVVRVSFFLSGSSISSFSVNRTTLKRVYEVKTDWRKFQVNLTGSYSVDFAERLAAPVAEWQKPNATTFYYESKQTGAPDILFYLVVPSSAMEVRAVGDTVFYEMQPYLEDQLLGTPFLILIALVVALAIILLYRKVR